ncbi:amidohydrolase [Vibrio sp. ZSDE26]|uniref:Amidohydrolase n=1 Tax=Vibrio amylolyticus TaxID=2847292 RepID=A0A9X1XLF8_9VIBR|nr:amidohydrolase [Vibrio amylolyticus]MCK6265127.1 amidohydrolase [Vibrio amylolyticus]
MNNQSLFFGGSIITMNDNQPTVEALLVEDGIIKATGNKTTLAEQYPNAVMVDLEGQTLMPSFIENHSHILLCANMEQMTDLSFFKYQVDEEMMAAFRSMTPNKDGWLMGIGWDVKKQSIPTLAEIDEAHPDLPMFITMQGHGGWLNSKAFEELGITKESEPPQNSQYVKDENGELTGMILGQAAVMQAYKGTFPAPLAEDVVAVSAKYAEEGITTASDLMIMAPKNLATMVEASKDEQFKVRIVGGIVNNFPEFPQVISQKDEYKTDKFRIGFLKAFTDGSVQGGNASTAIEYQNEEFKNMPRPLWGTQDMFNQTAQAATQLGVDFIFHANGELALEAALDAVEHARNSAKENGIDVSNFMSCAHHLSLTTASQFDRMVELNTRPSFIMGHLYWTGGQIIHDYFKADDLHHTFKVKTAIEKGLRPTLHNDAPVTPTKPWQSIKAAVTRETYSGDILNAEEAITVEQALKGYTIWAAEQFKMEAEYGSLEAGKVADMIIIDKNPLNLEAKDLDTVKVQTTYMQGEVTYKA